MMLWQGTRLFKHVQELDLVVQLMSLDHSVDVDR